MTLAYIALGSNLGDPRQHVLKAMDALASLPGTSALRRSRLYLTPPWGLLEQPAFVNAVVALETPLAPLVLLDALQAIEQQAGRVRGLRNGPRTLDLDLLYMAGVRFDDERLVLPHPRMAERAFVLLPLADIAPGLRLAPSQDTVAALLTQCGAHGCTVLA